MCLLNGDNIGYVTKGEKPLYAQHTMFQDIVIRSPRLTELSIHSEDCQSRLLREPTHDWLELCQQDVIKGDLAKETVGVYDEDFDTLTRVLLEGIHLVQELELDNHTKVGEMCALGSSSMTQR